MADKKRKKFGNRVSGESKLDNRILKTRRSLSQALIELIIEKGYNQVSIQDILERALIGRSTFYEHFENKEQLFSAGFKNLEVALFEDVAPGKNLSFRPLFEHAAQNLRLAKALIGKSGGDLLANSLRAQIAERIRRSITLKGGGSHFKSLVHFRSEAVASAIVSLLQCWLDDDARVPIALVTEQADAWL